MTGLLAVTGVIVVLVASAYAGLSGDEAIDVRVPGMEITPVTDVDSDDAGDEDASDNAGEAEATPTPAGPEAEPTQVLNRLDCNEIRGTDYASPEERTWFLANCVNN